MARIVWEGAERPALYEVAEHFSRCALESDSSLFDPARAVWSAPVLDELHHLVVEGADWGPGDFQTKLGPQLEGGSDEAVQLLAELLFFNLLAAADMKAATKRTRIEFVLGLMDKPVTIPPELAAAYEVGIANLGPGATHRYWHLVYLIEFARRWKKLSDAERRRLLRDPWDFKGFLGDQETPSAGVQRAALLHLLFPDEFEPVLAASHRKKIIKTFEDLLDEPTDDEDRALLQLRAPLAERFGEDFHWYMPGVKELWQPAKKTPWDELAHWAGRLLDIVDLDDFERDYKVDFAEELGRVRDSLRNDAEWPAALSRALRSVNLLNWRQIGKIEDWCAADPGAAREALSALWDPARPVGDRVTRFGRAIEDVITGQGTRVAVTSVLLLAEDPTDRPPYRPQAFARFRALVDYPGPDMPCDDGERYEHALAFFDTVRDELGARHVRLRDRLDTQGLLWTLVTAPMDGDLAAWDEDERKAFLRWRGDVPPAEADERGDGDRPTRDPLAAAAEDLMLPREFLARIKRLLTDRPQILFYGPPGTGKTYVARAFAQAVAGDPSRIELVQFHPSYAYEDFVEGYRPDPQAGGAGFALVDGPLKRLARRADDDPDNTYVLIIDELNRGNVAKVFGELYFLLEYRGHKITLQYSREQFTLPENLWVIGTMNTADRSIALMDAALRRRFYFQGFLPTEPPIRGLLDRWLARRAPSLRWVAEAVERANRQIGDPHFAIGPSYFLRKDLTSEWVETIWAHAVLPYLEEQFFGQEDELARFQLAALRDDVDDDAEDPEADPAEPDANADPT